MVDINALLANPTFMMGLGLLSGKDGNPIQGALQGAQLAQGLHGQQSQRADAERQQEAIKKITAMYGPQLAAGAGAGGGAGAGAGGPLPGQQGPIQGSALPPMPPELMAQGRTGAPGPMPGPQGPVPGPQGPMPGPQGPMPPQQGMMPPGPGPQAPPGPQQRQRLDPGEQMERLGLYLIQTGNASHVSQGVKLLERSADQRGNMAKQQSFREAIAGSENLDDKQKFRLATLPFDDAVSAYKGFAGPESEELVEVVNPKTGQPIYMRRSGAEGQRPPDKSPLVSINNAPKLEPGMVAVDPNDLSKGVMPQPGSTKDPANPRNWTGEQRKAANFARRMVISGQKITELEASGFNPAEALEQARGVGGRVTMSKEAKAYNDYRDDWIRAILRKESGASISDQERSDYAKYFPQLGDGAEDLARKAQIRESLSKGVIDEAGAAYQPGGSDAGVADAMSNLGITPEQAQGLAAQHNIPLPELMESIPFTAQKHGISEEEVIQRMMGGG